jgi:hypothetical protein
MSDRNAGSKAVKAAIGVMLVALGLSFAQTSSVAARDACTSPTCPNGTDTECGGNCTCSMPGGSCVFWP